MTATKKYSHSDTMKEGGRHTGASWIVGVHRAADAPPLRLPLREDPNVYYSGAKTFSSHGTSALVVARVCTFERHG